jgi:hypothetical protein
LAVGNHDGAPLAALGVVALAGGVEPSTASFALTWHSVPRRKAVHSSTCKAVLSG